MQIGTPCFFRNDEQIEEQLSTHARRTAMPEITTTIAQIDASSAARTTIRDHKLVTDRTVEKGGNNQGPMGGEIFAASLGACFMSNLIAAFQARGIEPRGLSATVTGTLEGTPPRYQKMAIAVSGAGVDRKQMDKMIAIAERGCIVANTLKPLMEVTIRSFHALDPTG